jgi:hypothetical protein
LEKEGVVHYTKLHGSLDWINQDNTIRRFALPFGADKPIDQFFPEIPSGENKISQLIIYPNAGKDRETAEYPYVELFRDLAAAICRPNATPWYCTVMVLVMIISTGLSGTCF